MGNHVKCLANVEVNNIHAFLLAHQVSYLIVEGYQVG